MAVREFVYPFTRLIVNTNKVAVNIQDQVFEEI